MHYSIYSFCTQWLHFACWTGWNCIVVVALTELNFYNTTVCICFLLFLIAQALESFRAMLRTRSEWIVLCLRGAQIETVSASASCCFVTEAQLYILVQNVVIMFMEHSRTATNDFENFPECAIQRVIRSRSHRFKSRPWQLLSCWRQKTNVHVCMKFWRALRIPRWPTLIHSHLLRLAWKPECCADV